MNIEFDHDVCKSIDLFFCSFEDFFIILVQKRRVIRKWRHLVIHEGIIRQRLHLLSTFR